MNKKPKIIIIRGAGKDSDIIITGADRMTFASGLEIEEFK